MRRAHESSGGIGGEDSKVTVRETKGSRAAALSARAIWAEEQVRLVGDEEEEDEGEDEDEDEVEVLKLKLQSAVAVLGVNGSHSYSLSLSLSLS